ncbi:hypothetical protein [Pontiella sp.]|uniref:hypothetical protein n=1 Tax=Pontiella sp. TaxID=2837462 RepID=UPI00356A6168
MKRFVLQLVALVLAASSFGLGTADLLDDAEAKALLEKKCIRFGTSELLPIPFETACKTLEQPDLLKAVQEEFARSVSENGQVDFPVFDDGGGKYHYINEKGHRTDIKELYRKKTDDHSFDYIVWATGKRFFGRYDVVVHLQIVDAGALGIAYSVSTHAYPHNWLTRFSARKVAPTKKYFAGKMKLVSYIAREVGIGLCQAEAFRQELEGGGPRHPTGEPPLLFHATVPLGY